MDGADDAHAVFRMRGVSKIYRMGEVEVRALDHIDLDLSGGEFVVLLGASGSGKSDGSRRGLEAGWTGRPQRSFPFAAVRR